MSNLILPWNNPIFVTNLEVPLEFLQYPDSLIEGRKGVVEN